MSREREGLGDSLEYQDEAYFDSLGRDRAEGGFDARLLREPATCLSIRKPIVMGSLDSATDAMRAMQGEGRGAVVVTEDGSPGTSISGIFTERDVLFRIVDGGRNPAVLALSDVMTPEPECLYEDQTVAEVLNVMSVGGFRHIPIVDAERRPVFVVSVKDVVQFLVDAFPREVLNLSPDRQRQREGG